MTDANVALLVVRIALGAMLAAHGLNKVLGGGGLAGAAGWFESMGLRPGWLHARVAASAEIGAGALMCLGLATPVAGAAFVGLMCTAALTDHRGKGFFIFKGGWEYVGLVGLVAVVVVCLGPGEWSLDNSFGWSWSGLAWAVGATAAGLVASLGLLLSLGLVGRRPAEISGVEQ